MVFDIMQIERKIEQEKERLKEQEHALLVLKKMVGNSNKIYPAKELDVIQDKNSAVVVKKSYHFNFSSAVKNVVESFGTKDFTVSQVEKILLQNGGSLPRHPRSRIAMVLQELTKKQKIIVARKGTGCKPYHYRKATATDYKISYRQQSATTNPLNGSVSGYKNANLWQ